MLEISNPKNYFENNRRDLEEVVSVVREAFGRNMDYLDIFNHVTSPEQVFLLKQDKELVAMASYSYRTFAYNKCAIFEGMAVVPKMQGKGVFSTITENAFDKNKIYAICLRTQNPHTYRAAEKISDIIYPNGNEIPKVITDIRNDFADYQKCKIDENGIVKGCYGKLLNGKEQNHPKVDPLFQRLGINKHNGDALLVIGRLKNNLSEYAEYKCYIGL